MKTLFDNLTSVKQYPVIIRLEDGTTKGYSSVEEAMKYVAQHHARLFDEAKKYIEGCLDRGSGGIAKVIPWKAVHEENNPKTPITIDLGKLLLS